MVVITVLGESRSMVMSRTNRPEQHSILPISSMMTTRAGGVSRSASLAASFALGACQAPPRSEVAPETAIGSPLSPVER